jgi:uncharacterized protein YdeI (YjbR/CyaY-like superfamily)
MKKEESEAFCPGNRKEWRQWLQKNHRTKKSVWLVQYKMKTKVSTISWSEAVDEALCFGWIDSVRKTIDHEKFIQFFSKRKPKSVWSKINKAKVEQLIADELMIEAGLESIAIAKQNGSWNILNEVEELIIPKDLEKEFKKHKGSKDFFLSISKSVRKAILQWLVLAKLPATRQRRIKEVAELAGKKMKPKQF